MVGIYTNLERDKNLKVTKLLLENLERAGILYCMHSDAAKLLKCDCFFDENSIPQLELMIALGGDGTILSALQFCSGGGIPIVGINLGKVGFLAEIDVCGIKSFVDKIAAKKYGVSDKNMLSVSFDGQTFDALNEISISRNKAERSINFQVFVRDEAVSSFFGDGFLVSTPTGSTAYSLSAGGPIVSYDVRCLILTPLNAHSLFSRSMIVGGDERVVVTVDNCVSVISDGKLSGITDNEVVISKSTKIAKFAVFNEKNFYSKLRKKLGSISILPEDK